jgi:hypothetical protein
MKKVLTITSITLLISLFSIQSSFAQRFLIGPRITGNLNIFNAKNLVGTWNGVGVGIGGTLDLSFNQHIGIMVNLTPFDMKNFSNSVTNNNTTTETSWTMSYVTVDPMFKAEFSGFYLVGGPSIAIKINSSGEQTRSTPGQNPTVTPLGIETKTVVLDLALGTGYNFTLSPDLYLGTDFMAYIPITDTYNLVSTSNSIFSLKLGVSLKFKIN